MKNKTLLLLLFLGIIFLSSCSVKYIRVVDEVIPPPHKELMESERLVLLDRSREQSLLDRLEGVKGLTPSNVFLKECVQATSFPFSQYNKREKHANQDNPAPRLSPAEVKKYLDANGDLLSLEHYYFRKIREYTPYQKHQLDEDGNDYYIDVVKGTELTTLEAYFRMYDGETGEVLVELPYIQEDVFEAEALSQAAVNLKIDTLNTVNPNDLKNQIRNSFLADVRPKSITSSWKYFKKGGNIIEHSAALIKEKKFESAVSYLTSNIEKFDSQKKPMRAQFNYATALLLAGDRLAAIEVARDGLNQYGSKEFVHLIDKINNSNK